MSTPSKSFFRMKFTTPAMASAPYTAEAPPVIVSTRSIAADGIELVSTSSAAFAGWRAAAVDQHEGAVRADAAQVQAADAERGRRAGLDALIELRAFGHELRHLVQHALDADRARVLEPLPHRS